MKQDESPLIGDKTVEQWAGKWTKVPGGLKRHQSHLRDSVGLYRLRLQGRDVAVGTGTDRRGGLAKRYPISVVRARAGGIITPAD